MDEPQRLGRLSKKGRPELGDGDGDGGEAAAASTFMSDVSDDLLLEILIRPPDARALIQFSSVCKRWFSLVSRSVLYFIHEFNPRRGVFQSNRLKITCSRPEKSKIFRPSSLSVSSSSCYLDHNLDWPSPSPPPQPRVLSWFDDFSLVGLSRRKLYDCNPVTRQQILLPDPPAHEHTQTMERISIQVSGETIFLALRACWEPRNHVLTIRGENNFEGIVTFDPFKGAADSQRCRLNSLAVEFGRGWRDKCNRVRLGVVV
ncbi:F-box domain containing protein [Parasponia andersonii]|uniref:F-box domain containing protein n=1 Tax=Parasponia andersonii TaxID=3476 RepID=A0A2P5D7R9_PARAD|nr:F-box domain containing protein [Parasponia andersonii]